MSQAGKVLHLYVEVRPVAEEDGTLPGNTGTGQLMLQCPEVRPCSQRSSNRSSSNYSPELSPATHLQLDNNCVSPSKSRESVVFQLQSPDVTGSSGQVQRHMCDSFGQLLQVLAPETLSHSGQHGSTGQTWSERDPKHGRVLLSPSSASSGRRTSFSNLPRPCAVPGLEGDGGQTSLVSYGYIEKSHVHKMGGRHAPVSQSELDKAFHRSCGQFMPPDQKRLSDPLWYTGQPGHGGHPKTDYPYSESQNLPQWCWSYTQRAANNLPSRDTRTSDEFATPVLRRRYGGYSPANCSPTMPRNYQSPRCRSWAGSPVLPRGSLTLPSKAHPLELDRGVCRNSVNGLPRSPASDHLCAHTQYSPYSMAPPINVPSPSLSHRAQRPQVMDERPSLSSKFYPPLPAGRPTDIQHELSVSGRGRTDHQTIGKPPHCGNYSYNANNANRSHSALDSLRYSGTDDSHPKSQYSSSRSSRTINAASPTSSRRSISPSSNDEVAGKQAVYACKLSAEFADRRTPSPTSSQAESQRSESPNTDGTYLHPYATLLGRRSPQQIHRRKTEQTLPQTRPGRISPVPSRKGQRSQTQSPVLDLHSQQAPSPGKSSAHHYQPPQYAGNHRGPATEQRQHNHLSPEWSRRSQTKETPVSCTARNHECRGSGPVQRGDNLYEDKYRQSTCSANGARRDEHHGKLGRNLGVKGMQMPLISVSREQTELLDHTGGGTSSQSSSGVTGSVGDSSQPSPETLSQSSQDTSGSGSAMQSDRSSETPASRSQRIARAKWEFLFGGQREENHCRRDAPFSPNPSSPSSVHVKTTNQRKVLDKAAQKASHHKVRQIEVELVTSDPCDFAPKTGIIRHTIKYSETDLDAVPLRCYRETDLDEVMRAEAEASEDINTTFENNHSIRGYNSLKPGDAYRNPRMDGGKEGKEEEGEEEEKAEGDKGTTSWFSLKVPADKQRHRAAEVEEEVFRTSEALANAQGGLKSPISIGSPRRPSENHLDSFSRHFESIMESHRAKGTSYSSLDSVDLLTSGSTSVFTFDLPTLTPEIQSQICESAKQIIELSFAPLTHPDPSVPPETSRSELSLSASGAGLQSGSKDDSIHPVRSMSEKASWRRSILKEGFRKANSTPSLHSSPRERPVNRPLELLYPQVEQLELGGSDDGLANGTKADLQAAKRLAKRLYNLEGFKKSDVARHLSKNNEFSQMVVEEYLSNFDFTAMTIDQALRTFLRKFALIGETQERERVLAHFSKRYRECNRESETNEDSIHTLTCAVMLLNTDLHGNNVGKRMSCSQFISNLEGLNDGHDFPKDLLKTLYNSIKNEKLQWTIDEEEMKSEVSDTVRTDSASHTMKRLGSGGNPLVGVAQQVDGELYKSGFLVRKVHADPDGKRTPRGKRGWKSFYILLKGLVLYLQKDEYRAERELTEEDVKNAVSVHHSLAMRAADYSKRPNVFYLRTADWRVFLFQAPNAEEMQSWITRINLVAAMFSAPPFPAAIGSQKRFSRPLLPGSNTKLTQEEQAKSHENRFRSVCSELVDLTVSTPERKVKGRELEEQKARQEYLEFEKTRYGTYAMLLRAKLLSGDEDLSAFEARLFSDGGLQRAHSSPTLPQDSSATKEKPSKKSKSMKVTSSSSSTSKSAGSGVQEGGKKNSGAGELRPELQRQSSKQEEAA